MSDAEENAVHAGQLNFLDGSWVVAERHGHRMTYAATATGAVPAATGLADPFAETCKLGPDSFAETCKLEPKTSAQTCKLGLPFPALYIQRTSIQSTTTTPMGSGGADRAQAFDDSELNEQAWTAKCAELSDAANRGCGLVYEVFELRLGASIDAELEQVPELLRARAIEIATRHGYTTTEQRAQTERMLQDDGCCSHGLDPHCCPMGCGDIDSGDDARDELEPDACEFVAIDSMPEP